MTAASEARKRDAVISGMVEAWSHGDRYAVYPGSSTVDDLVLADAALAGLQADGWVILRAESARRAQERLRVAQALRDYADELRAGTDKWARDAYAENARLRDRLTFLYGEARARGASIDDLRGPT